MASLSRRKWTAVVAIGWASAAVGITAPPATAPDQGATSAGGFVKRLARDLAPLIVAPSLAR